MEAKQLVRDGTRSNGWVKRDRLKGSARHSENHAVR